MEIRHLNTFLAVSRLLSFNKAAQQLHYAQSSVSAQIQALEHELDVKLFDRLGRRVLLTEAGEQLIKYAHKMVALADETKVAFRSQGQLQGALTIRIPESFGTWRLPTVLQAFNKHYPQVDLHLITCAREGLSQDLRKGVTDLAFLLDESIQAADLEVEMLGSESLVLVAHPAHPLCASGPVTSSRLAAETWLMSRVDCSYRRLVETCLQSGGGIKRAPLELNSLAVLKACLVQGVGISVLPCISVAPELASGVLALIDWPEGPKEVALLMVWYRQRWLSPIVSGFMEYVRHAYPDAS